MFKNKPWKKWRTRKITFVSVVLFWFAYTVLGITLGFFEHSLDATLTDNIFKAGEWIITTGCAITLTEIIKNKNNVENDEEEGGE